MNTTYEFEEISTPKSPGLLRKNKKSPNGPNDSSRGPLREKRSVRWQDEEEPFEIPEEDEENLKPKPDKVVSK